MATLYLQQNSAKTKALKLQMTDQMWRKVVIEYSDEDTYLELPDGTIVLEITQIIGYLDNSPSLTRKLLNAHRAATRVFNKAIDSGELKADKLEIASRRSLCTNCPFNQKKWLTNTCIKCGCNIKLKTTLLTESCPLNKW